MAYTINLLKQYEDKAYADFHSRLVPTVERERIIGVRTPVIRMLAKELLKDERFKSELLPSFLNELPHYYYDETILHGAFISREKDFQRALYLTEQYLQSIDNWAACDLLDPKVFAKHKSELLDIIKRWLSSDSIYTVRFGIVTLLRYYLDADFDASHLELVQKANGDDYYIKMAKAWYYSTALVKQYDITFDYVINRIEDDWVKKKSIQKARESFRLTPEQKDSLKLSIKHD